MAEVNIIDRLKDVFTSNIIVRKKDNKVVVSKIKSSNDTFVDRFQKVFKGKYNSNRSFWSGMHNGLEYQSKNNFYADYDQMDQDSIISAALDIFADESVLKFEDGEMIKIFSENEQIKVILDSLFNDILNLEFNLWPWIRNLVKYGDFYFHPIMQENYGITDFELFSVYDVARVENLDGTITFDVNGEKYDDFEIIHIRLLSDSNFFPYGRSMIEGGRKVWRQLCLVEDAMLIHRIMRAPEKRIFKIDVGNLAPKDVNSYMEKVIAEMKKEPYLDAEGNINLEFNLHNMMEDIFMPVRGGKSGTEISTLPSPQYDGIADVEYLRGKLMASLKIPRQFLNYTENSEGKATLAAMDLRFARTIERIQSVILSELYNLAYIHLTLQGFSKKELLDFSLELNNPSIVYQQEKLSFLTQKISVAKDLKDLNMFSTDYIYKNIFKLSDGEIKHEIDKLFLDKKRDGILTMMSDGKIEDNEIEDFQKASSLESDFDDEESGAERPDKNPLKHNFNGGSPLALT